MRHLTMQLTAEDNREGGRESTTELDKKTTIKKAVAKEGKNQLPGAIFMRHLKV